MSTPGHSGLTAGPQRVPILPPGFEVRPPHRSFLGTQKRFSAAIGGIGSGKSAIGVIRAHLYAASHPGSLGMIVAPTVPMLRDSTLRSFLQWAPPGFVVNHNKNEGLITLRNGSEIMLRSAHDPESLRGPNVSWVFVDEAALLREAAWQIIKGRARDARFPIQLWLATTPRGRRHWLYREFVESGSPLHRMIRFRTADNEHHLGDGFIASLGYTGVFAQQELEGLFVAYEGLVYPEFTWETHEWKTSPAEIAAYPWARRECGVDWGYTAPAVLLPGLCDGDGRWRVPEEVYVRQRTIDELVPEAVRLRDTYGITVFRCDPSEPEYIEAFRRAGLNAVGADNAIMPGISSVRSALARRGDGTVGLAFSRECVHTAAEFEAYQWSETKDLPATGQPDHAMDALRYLLHSPAQGGRGVFVVGDTPTSGGGLDDYLRRVLAGTAA